MSVIDTTEWEELGNKQKRFTQICMRASPALDKKHAVLLCKLLAFGHIHSARLSCVYIYIYTYIDTYIHIWERERERGRGSVCVWSECEWCKYGYENTWIYIYIYRRIEIKKHQSLGSEILGWGKRRSECGRGKKKRAITVHPHTKSILLPTSIFTSLLVEYTSTSCIHMVMWSKDSLRLTS